MIELEPWITWLLVRISPVEVRIIPVPAASPLWSTRVEVTSTIAGSAAFAIAVGSTFAWLTDRTAVDAVEELANGFGVPFDA